MRTEAGVQRRQFLLRCGRSVMLGMIASRTAAAVGAPHFDYPEGVVRDFLKLHFAGTRAFNASGLDNKKRLLTRRFRNGIFKFFDARAKAETALPLVVDPFTGSMGAREFSVGDAKVRAEKAWVPVQFTDGTNDWTVTYLMRNDQERNDDRWRIDDIEDRRGMLLSSVLRKT